jgi:hypothetical protein
MIPSSVELVGAKAFEKCAHLSSILFESDSRLRGIESEAFASTSLQSFIIPRNLRFNSGSAFHQTKVSSISIEPENERFIVVDQLLIDQIDHVLISCFSSSSHFEIPSYVERLSEACFSPCPSISSISFAPDSRLT